MDEIFNKIDINSDNIISIEELENAPSNIKKIIAKKFEEKYNIRFGTEHGIDKNEFYDFLGNNKISTPDSFYSQSNGNSSLKNTLYIDENYNKTENFIEDVKNNPIYSINFLPNIEKILDNINKKSQEKSASAGGLYILKSGKEQIGTYFQNGEKGIIEISYSNGYINILLNGYDIGSIYELNTNEILEEINNLGKEINYIPNDNDKRLKQILLLQNLKNSNK